MRPLRRARCGRVVGRHARRFTSSGVPEMLLPADVARASPRAAFTASARGGSVTPPPSLCVWCGRPLYAVGGGVWAVEGGGIECDAHPLGNGRHAPRHFVTRRRAK